MNFFRFGSLQRSHLIIVSTNAAHEKSSSNSASLYPTNQSSLLFFRKPVIINFHPAFFKNLNELHETHNPGFLFLSCRGFNKFWRKWIVQHNRRVLFWKAFLSRGVGGHAPLENFEILDSCGRIFPHFEVYFYFAL